ncbi:hypothetical protein O181_003879 [Austropuccinia psidii MF-1]|uniref:Uncharacterized protein n=1 Tax=Austropuccinia psidii MF-1 TaxID=1389203 RepID=A0A9Q3BF65_9BASI|nr:hypothetical protein [Austropuccinia psidii MF-1]
MCKKICFKEVSYKELVKITKGWNPNKQFKPLEKREAKMRKNKARIQAIGKQCSQKENALTPSGSQGVGNKPNSKVDSHHSGTNRSVARSHNSSQSQAVSRRREGPRGK